MAEQETAALSHDAFVERMKNFVAKDPSPRNPRVSTHNSHPDRIEAAYQADRHTTWGYVIYRTTYENNADWTEFMRRLRVWAEDSMGLYNGQDVLDKMSWTIFEDKEHFDGADTNTIRDHFLSWIQSAVQLEQPQQPGGTPADVGRSPRYRYCVQVDAEALKSCVHDAPPPPDFDRDNQGWVKLIDKTWICEWDPEDEDEEEEYDSIEGVTERHVGWVRCPFPSVMIEYYMRFLDLNGYMVEYRRPPAIIGFPWNT
ncbi:hypothetical protein KCU62_g997, partial [Aureobasidium sp. EXF-3399]